MFNSTKIQQEPPSPHLKKDNDNSIEFEKVKSSEQQFTTVVIEQQKEDDISVTQSQMFQQQLPDRFVSQEQDDSTTQTLTRQKLDVPPNDAATKSQQNSDRLIVGEQQLDDKMHRLQQEPAIASQTFAIEPASTKSLKKHFFTQSEKVIRKIRSPTPQLTRS